MLILIAGPYRSGTNDDPQLMQQNLSRLETVALPLFRKGHIPMIGEWVALPLMQLAGSTQPGDAVWEEVQYPVAHRLLDKCDAVLRLQGASKGADEDVRIAREKGLKVYFSVDGRSSQIGCKSGHCHFPPVHSCAASTNEKLSSSCGGEYRNLAQLKLRPVCTRLFAFFYQPPEV